LPPSTPRESATPLSFASKRSTTAACRALTVASTPIISPKRNSSRP